MKTAVYNIDKDSIEIKEMPVPEIGDEEILVKPIAVGVCASEVAHGHLKEGGSLGHELAGIVHKPGKKVVNLKEGDRVFVHHHVPCLVCHYCRRGYFTMCPQYSEFGFDPTGYAEYTRIQARNVNIGTIKIPDHISFEEGCLIEPISCIWRALKRANIQAGDIVLIMGAGFIGLTAVQLVKILSAGLVIISDSIDFKLKKAQEVRADIIINHSKENVLEKIKEATGGRKADIVMITSSTINSIKEAIKLTEKGGTIIQFGVTGSNESLPIIPYSFLKSEFTYFGTYSSSHIDTNVIANFLSYGKLKVRPLISKQFKLDQVQQAIEFKRNTVESLKIIINPNEEE